MLKSLAALCFLGALPGAALAQGVAPTSPTNSSPAAQAPAAPKPATIKKVVCQRVDVEETTGSRLGSAPKVCRTIEVPAPGGGNGGGGRAPANPERG